MNYNKWEIMSRGDNVPKALLDAGFSPLLAALLAVRGMDTVDKAHEFVSGSEEVFLDPMQMKGMPEAVERIRLAVARREKVAVYGDYDVDGITSTCLLTDWFRSKGLECLSYIPDRIAEGYGLNIAAMDVLHSRGVSLIVTVDCGITASHEAEHAKEMGVDLIITDHHECREQTLPAACAVIDPKQEGCTYKNKELAGVGVALKLVCAVEGSSAAVERYADIAAIGTVADVVPLRDENRFIVKRGLEKIAAAPRAGIAALMKEAGVSDRRISASTIGFSLAPRLNAAGRLGDVAVAQKLLMTNSSTEAEKLASQLCELNRRRQALETGIWNDATAMMCGKSMDIPIVLSSDSWHQGVIGIAASKLSEQYALPTVMICLDGEKGKGSCRSYGGFNLFDALSACADYLEGFGGHALAAGLSIRRERLDGFCRAFAQYYRENRPTQQPTLHCDLEILDPDMLSMDCVSSLSLMEPFGSGNPKPIMCINGARLERISAIGCGRHLKMSVRFAGREFDCVFFSHTQEELGLREGDTIDIAFTPQINEFHFRSTVQLQLAAARRHDPRPMCEKLLGGAGDMPLRSAAMYCPDRSAFVSVWRKLQKGGGTVASDMDGIMRQCPGGVEPERFCLCLLALCELGLVRKVGASMFGAKLVTGTKKVNLEDSKLIRNLKARK